MRKLTAAIAALVLAGTVAASPAFAATSVSGGGSSFAGKRISSCAASYKTDSVTYAASSSGTGRTQFTAGSIDFAGTDSAYGLSSKDTLTDVINIPVTGGPITFAYNVPGVSTLKVSAALLSDIYTGKITNWNDAAIKKLNTSARLPNLPIIVVYRAGTSGTSGNLTNWLTQNNPGKGWSVNEAFDKANTAGLPATAISASGSSVMATTVSKTKGAIGYLDLADSISKALKLASLENKYVVSGKTKTQYVKPTAASAGLFLGAQTLGADGKVAIDYTMKIKNAYSASLFTYVATAANGTKGAAVRGFVNYLISGCKATPGYAALPKSFQTKLQALAAKIK